MNNNELITVVRHQAILMAQKISDLANNDVRVDDLLGQIRTLVEVMEGLRECSK